MTLRDVAPPKLDPTFNFSTIGGTERFYERLDLDPYDDASHHEEALRIVRGEFRTQDLADESLALRICPVGYAAATRLGIDPRGVAFLREYDVLTHLGPHPWWSQSKHVHPEGDRLRIGVPIAPGVAWSTFRPRKGEWTVRLLAVDVTVHAMPETVLEGLEGRLASSLIEVDVLPATATIASVHRGSVTPNVEIILSGLPDLTTLGDIGPA